MACHSAWQMRGSKYTRWVKWKIPPKRHGSCDQISAALLGGMHFHYSRSSSLFLKSSRLLSNFPVPTVTSHLLAATVTLGPLRNSLMWHWSTAFIHIYMFFLKENRFASQAQVLLITFYSFHLKKKHHRIDLSSESFILATTEWETSRWNKY